MTAEQKLKYARTILPMVEPFYGSLVFNAQTIITDKPGTAWTDGVKIYFNRAFADELTKEQFTGVLLHEVLHIAYQHIPRMLQQKLNRDKWNYATDYVINWQIKQIGQQVGKHDVQLPEGVLLDENYANMSAEQVYALLPDMPEDSTYALSKDIQQEHADGEALSRASEEWRGHVAQAMTQARMRGELPEGVSREIEDFFYPKLDWREKLKQFVQAFPTDYDFMTRDRRFLQQNIVLPSLSGERVKGAVVLDTSGSIDTDTLKTFLSEVFGIVSAFNRVDLWVLSCDAAVHNPQEVSSVADVEAYKPQGFGGTDFRPAFFWLKENVPEIQFVVYFSDGYGEFGDDPGIPVLWVMTTDVVAPYGLTIPYTV